MSSEVIELIVVTPERPLIRERVMGVTLPGAAGCLGILPGHAPLITELGIGELQYRIDSASPVVAVTVMQGFAEVLGHRVTVLAETAERAEEIDVSRAAAARKRAEERLASGRSDVDWDRAVVALQRALVRIQVAAKRHSAAVLPQ